MNHRISGYPDTISNPFKGTVTPKMFFFLNYLDFFNCKLYLTPTAIFFWCLTGTQNWSAYIGGLCHFFTVNSGKMGRYITSV